MTDDDILCVFCMSYHAPPACKHDNTKLCPTCGKPRGYPATGQRDTTQCWRCWEATP